MVLYDTFHAFFRMVDKLFEKHVWLIIDVKGTQYTLPLLIEIDSQRLIDIDLHNCDV